MLGSTRVGNAAATRTKTSETRLQDESSSVVFSIRENLGNGLAAVGRVDFRGYSRKAPGPLGTPVGGLDSNSLGSLTMGRHSFHYFKTPEDAYFLGASYRVHPSSLIDFAGGGRGSPTRISNPECKSAWTFRRIERFPQAIVGWSASPTVRYPPCQPIGRRPATRATAAHGT